MLFVDHVPESPRVPESHVPASYVPESHVPRVIESRVPESHVSESQSHVPVPLLVTAVHSERILAVSPEILQQGSSIKHREHSKRSEGISEAISKEISKTISREIFDAFSPRKMWRFLYFPLFEVHCDGNAGPRWKKWLGRFERLTIGMGISDDKRNRALLLHNSGPGVDEIFDTLQDVGEDKDYEKAVEKLTAHFSPRVNVTYEVHNFRQAKQEDGETLDCFHARLRSWRRTAISQIQTKKSKDKSS